MRKTAKILGAFIGITGMIQIALGVLFWTGAALALIPLHMWIGILFVLSLWTLSVMGFRASLPMRSSAMLVWGVVVVVLGFTQQQLLPGPYHWIIRVLHLAVGWIAMGLGRTLAVRIQKTAASTGARGPAASIEPARPMP
jgi:hypothetical protein